MPAVIAPDYDNGVLFQTRTFQCLENAPHLCINETDTGEVTSREIPPLLLFPDPAQARFREVPVQVP